MTLVELADRLGGWLSADGPHAEVVTSSRVRLARNLIGIPFPHRAEPAGRRNTFDRIADAAKRGTAFAEATVWDLQALSTMDRRLLVERHLASPRLASGEGPRGVIVGEDERRTLQINEEDHLRIQSVVSGFDLERALAGAVEVDRELEEHLEFAVSEDRGYLTACPTNVGTGMRASVLIHFPGLVLAGEIKKVHRAVGEMGMAVRGWFGEGSGALGDFYQLSNQRTLGQTEEESVEGLARVVKRVHELEIETRERLRESSVRSRRIADRVHRALGTLRHARLLTVEQAMACTSDLRLGIWMGMLEPIPAGVLHRVMLLSQPAHLARRLGDDLEGDEERWARAAWIRPQFGGETDSPAR